MSHIMYGGYVYWIHLLQLSLTLIIFNLYLSQLESFVQGNAGRVVWPIRILQVGMRTKTSRANAGTASAF